MHHNIIYRVYTNFLWKSLVIFNNYTFIFDLIIIHSSALNNLNNKS